MAFFSDWIAESVKSSVGKSNISFTRRALVIDLFITSSTTTNLTSSTNIDNK